MMAAILPTSVLFHIHHVVAALNRSRERKEYPKKLSRLVVLSATISSGTKAIKSKKQKGDTGHAPYNNIPTNKLKNNSKSFFMLQMYSNAALIEMKKYN